MAKIDQINPFAETKQVTNRDSAQMGVLTSERYEADSTAAQTVINLSFSVTQTTEQKRAFQLYVDGSILREGAGNDFTFTNITGAVSAQVTLNAPIAAGLNIIALKVGGYQDLFPNPSSVTASLSVINLQLDQKGNFNRVINGAMDFWQRNTTFTAIATATYFADRWKHNKVGATVATITRDTDVPTTAFGVYSATHTVTTGSGAPAAGDNVILSQHIEGNIFRTLKGKNIVCRFWVRSPVAGVHCISFSNSADNRAMIKEYTVSVANTWEQKTIRFNHDTTGTWLYDTGIGMSVHFALMAGTNFQDVADTWITSNKYATVNQVNACLTVGYAFKITDVCVMEDNTALNSLPDFRLAGQDFRDELSLCQRYFEKSFSIDTVPIPANYTTALAPSFQNGNNPWDGFDSITCNFKTNKRISTPVVTTMNSTTLGSNAIEYVLSGSGPFNGTSGGSLSSDGYFKVSGNYAGTGSNATVNELRFHWTADSDF